MTKVPARPAAAVPARPVAAPKPGAAAIPSAAKAPTQSQQVTAPASAGTSPIAGISQNDGGAVTAAVNQPASTVAPSAGIEGGAITAEGQQTGIADSALVEGAQVVTQKRRGRKPGAGKSGGAPKKATYPGLLSVDENGAPVMIDDGKGGQYQQRNVLTEIPTDFDFNRHEKLKASDFTDEALYCDFMQSRFQSLANSWGKKAKRIRTLGTAVDQKKALKYLKMREQMAALAAQLKADGMDVDSMDDEGADEAAE